MVAAAAAALHSILHPRPFISLSLFLSLSHCKLPSTLHTRFTTLSSLPTYLRPPYPNPFTRSRQSAFSPGYSTLCFFTYVCDRITSCTREDKKEKSVLWSFLYQYDFENSSTMKIRSFLRNIFTFFSLEIYIFVNKLCSFFTTCTVVIIILQNKKKIAKSIFYKIIMLIKFHFPRKIRRNL